MRRLRCVASAVWLLVFVTLIAFPATADEAHPQAKANIESGRIDLALEQLKGAVTREANDYQAWFLLGVAYTRGQQFHQAMESFRRVIEIKPQLAEPHYNLAVIYNELGDYRAAINELERSLIKKPGDAIAEENLADLYLKLALKNYRSALNRAPSQALEERYMRLLKVRGPQGAPDLTEERVRVAIPAAITKPVKEKIRKAVEVWRRAWSEQDLELYFSKYAPDFQLPERFTSIEQWRHYKQQVIGSKNYIHIELNDLKITVDLSGKRASIDFFQKFRSNGYDDDGFKRLEMKLYNGEWKIVSEVSIS